MNDQANVMTPDHPLWDEFCVILEGPEGCNFQEDEKGRITWDCKAGRDKTHATDILTRHFPEVDIEASLKFFDENGGHCDCEIIFNVDR